jgi:hypothetical protein
MVEKYEMTFWILKTVMNAVAEKFSASRNKFALTPARNCRRTVIIRVNAAYTNYGRCEPEM